MKKADIRVGEVYSNGRGRLRLVVDEGEQFRAFSSQENADCVKFLPARLKRCGAVVLDGVASDPRHSPFGICTRASLASWAQRRLPVSDLTREVWDLHPGAPQAAPNPSAAELSDAVWEEIDQDNRKALTEALGEDWTSGRSVEEGIRRLSAELESLKHDFRLGGEPGYFVAREAGGKLFVVAAVAE
jgi:hypothetical protein